MKVYRCDACKKDLIGFQFIALEATLPETKRFDTQTLSYDICEECFVRICKTFGFGGPK